MKKALSLVFFLGLIFVSVSLTHRQKNTQNSTTVQQGWGVTESVFDYKNISNLNASNWIMGNQTIDEFNKELFKFVTNNNVTKCPIETPFLKVSDSKCVNCTGDKPIFDLKLKDCVACPNGTHHNATTHKCQPGAPAPTKPACTSNYVWNETQKKCICPEAFPIDLGCECVACLEPFVWNQFERTCKLRCEETHIWDQASKSCKCPKQTPYEVNGECIACSGPFEWKNDTQTCQLKVNPCATPSAPVTPTPVVTPTPTPVTPTPVVTPTVQTCNSNFVWDNNIKQCVCPADKPFNDGTKCVQCNLPQYWDHDLKQCLYCQGNTYFNTIQRNCVPCPADKPLFRNYYCEACPQNTVYDSRSNTCQQASIDPTATQTTPVTTTTTSPSYIEPTTSPKKI